MIKQQMADLEKQELKWKQEALQLDKSVREAMLLEAEKKKALMSYEKSAQHISEIEAAKTQIKELEKEQQRFWQKMTDADVWEGKILDSYNKLDPDR